MKNLLQVHTFPFILELCILLDKENTISHNMSFRIPANLMAGELILTIGGMNANGNLMNSLVLV